MNSSRLRMQPLGEPVLREMTLERKSSSQLHRGVLKPIPQHLVNLLGASLLTRCCRMMVLNAELKSRNNIRTCMFLPSRCCRLRCRGDSILCGAFWPVSKCGGKSEDNVVLTSLSKHFIMMG